MKKALVLLNMGGPNSLDEVEVFLKNMFNDKHIIPVKSDIFRSFIAFLIVSLRVKKARLNYAKLGGKSPIIGHTKSIVKKLQSRLNDTYVTYAMRYTYPFSGDIMEELKKRGINDITLFPLYPQYSTTTTKSSLEEFKKELHVDIKQVTRFYDNKLYNELLVDKIEQRIENRDAKEFELVFSAHSLPQRIIDRGDCYQKEILEHVNILKKVLKKRGLNFCNIHVAYQSKLGPIKWLKPSLEDKLKSLTCRKVLISPISFTVDNAETEFELLMEYKEIAKEIGFKEYLVARCPNDSNKFIDVILDIFKSS